MYRSSINNILQDCIARSQKINSCKIWDLYALQQFFQELFILQDFLQEIEILQEYLQEITKPCKFY